MEALNYKCPCCSSGLGFSAKSGKWDCGSCHNTFELETLKSYEEARAASEAPSNMDWQAYRGSEAGPLAGYSCPSCGAEIIADDITAATRCVYCGNPTVLPAQLSGVFKPDVVVPFSVPREQAQAALEKFSRKKPLLPSAFRAENRVKDITGTYIPYWLFGCQAEADIAYRATRSASWREGKYRVTRTDHFFARRRGGVDFENLPVDGSSKFTSEQTESIEPFDMGRAEEFSSAYLSGFAADKYDQDAEACAPRANERVDASTRAMFQSTVSEYESAVPTSARIDIRRGAIRYALLPVWLLNTKYRGKIYSFQVNGQTGKIAGNLPMSGAKYAAWLVGLGLGLAAAAAIVATVLLKTGVV